MSRMPQRCLATSLGALVVLCTAPASAQDGSGLRAVPRAEGLRALERATLGASARGLQLDLGAVRLGLTVTDAGSPGLSARLTGDYYLTGPGFGDGDVSGGLRLTSGLRVEPRRLGTTPLPAALSFATASAPAPLPGADRDPQHVTLPYIGLGYTSLAARGGWGLSADIGLGGTRSSQRLRLGSGSTANQVEKLLDDLRLAPVLQFGVSYAF